MDIPDGWQEINNKIVKTYKENDFRSSVDLVNKIMRIAEEINHHPDIHIENYNEVTIELTTHEEGKVTEKDVKVAKEINNL